MHYMKMKYYKYKSNQVCAECKGWKPQDIDKSKKLWLNVEVEGPVLLRYQFFATWSIDLM